MLTDVRNLLVVNARLGEISNSTADDLYDYIEKIVEHHVTAAVRNQAINYLISMSNKIEPIELTHD